MPAFGHFKDVHQSFARAGQPPLVAIESISFDLAVGQLATLLGPSGCGKTTFLKIVAGLMAASRGTVQINGRDVTEPHPDFGIVFQQANLMPWRTVLNNVRICALAESLGGVETLISHPVTMTHSAMPSDVRAQNGITDGLIRLSVGIEDVEDLIADLEHSLAKI